MHFEIVHEFEIPLDALELAVVSPSLVDRLAPRVPNVERLAQKEHRFEDGSAVVLTTGYAPQLEAFDALGSGLGRQWVDHVAAYADDWQVLRLGFLESPWTRA